MKIQNKKKEGGFIISSELIVIATVLVIGLVSGAAALRVEVEQELTDVGQAIGAIDQSFEYDGITTTVTVQAGGPFTADSVGSAFLDAQELTNSTVLAPAAEGGAPVSTTAGLDLD